MNIIELNDILINLKCKLHSNMTNLEKILNITDKKLDISTLNLLSKISENMNHLSNDLNDFYLELLGESDKIKSEQEKNRIRELKINNKVQEITLPLVLYTKLILENNYV